MTPLDSKRVQRGVPRIKTCVALPSTRPLLASARSLWRARPGWRHSLSHRIEQRERPFKEWPGDLVPWTDGGLPWPDGFQGQLDTPKPLDFRIRDACFQGLLRHTLLSLKLCIPRFQREILILFGWLVFCVIWQPAYLYRSTEMKLSFPSKEKKKLF